MTDLRKPTFLFLTLTAVVLLISPFVSQLPSGQEAPLNPGITSGPSEAAANWWIWPLLLLGLTFLIGVVAVPSGVGGGALFVPIVSGFFPFHLDFVRATGLLMGLSGSIMASPGLLRADLANLRLAIPAALLASAGSIFGALIGLAVPTQVVQILLGCMILLVSFLLARSQSAEFPRVPAADRLSRLLRIHGSYQEINKQEVTPWQVHRSPLGFALFLGVGVMAGMFGLGGGWANVAILNLLMGVPLKVSVGTSYFLLSVTNTSAAWIYMHRGCVLPLIVIPSLVGINLGTFVGSRLLLNARPHSIRWLVLAVLLFAGLRSLAKGLGI